MDSNITNDSLYKLFLYILNKTQTGNVFPIDQFGNIFNGAQLKFFKNKIGNPDLFKPGQPFSSQQDGLTEGIDNSLSPFHEYMTIAAGNPLMVNDRGIAPKPQDFFKRLSISYWQYINGIPPRLRPISVVSDDDWNNSISSKLSPPSMKSPIANIGNKIIRFYPIKSCAVDFTYRRLPIPPVYDYYIDPLLGIVYLPENTTYTLQTGQIYSDGKTISGNVTSKTVELEWQDNDKMDILSIVLSFQSINLRDKSVEEYSQMLKAGQ